LNLRNVFAELKRRNVYKVTIAYGVMAWLLMQVATIRFAIPQATKWKRIGNQIDVLRHFTTR
jgi:hypothetical protein